MNKKLLVFHAYQANLTENRCVAGIIILESPCSSTEVLEYKSPSYSLVDLRLDPEKIQRKLVLVSLESKFFIE